MGTAADRAPVPRGSRGSRTPDVCRRRRSQRGHRLHFEGVGQENCGTRFDGHDQCKGGPRYRAIVASTVDALFAAAGVQRLGAVQWRTAVPNVHPGVYVVARVRDPAGQVSGDAEIAPSAIKQLLETRKELTLDGQRPSPEALSDRLKSMWLSDEPVIYVGLAGTSLRNRVSQFYRTRLGARSPHAWGWPLKCISDLSGVWVHFGQCTEVKAAELRMLETFMSALTPMARENALDPDLPLPFANLEFRDSAKRRRVKRHGISGAKAAR